jgi:hypothetical protein
MVSLRTALEECFSALPPEVLEKDLDVSPLGVIPVEGWTSFGSVISASTRSRSGRSLSLEDYSAKSGDR